MKNLVRKARRIVQSLRGKDFLVRPDCRRANKRFGSGYGGWNVVAELLQKNSVVYCFGVGEDASFDIALIEAIGVTVHAFDPTPKSVAWVKKQNFTDKFVMHELGIADFDGEISFNPPENPEHASYTMLDRPQTVSQSVTAPVKRLGTIMKELGHDHIDLLKLDVEGAEYSVIEDLAKTGIRPTQLLIEFHHRFPSVGVAKSKNADRAIRAMGYGLFHVSQSGEEFCYILNDR